MSSRTPTEPDIGADLQRYLQQSRESVVSSLDGLSEYDIRRPVTPTATNLSDWSSTWRESSSPTWVTVSGRPSPVRLPWVEDESIWDGADMWAAAEETREYVLSLYRAASQHSDESIEQLGLDAPAEVSWWPEARRKTTLGSLLVRVWPRPPSTQGTPTSSAS